MTVHGPLLGHGGVHQARIYRDTTVPDQPYPWHFSVEDRPPREDALDYGSVATHAEAIAAVEWVMANPDQARGYLLDDPTVSVFGCSECGVVITTELVGARTGTTCCPSGLPHTIGPRS